MFYSENMIEIWTEKDRVLVRCPFSPTFVSAARSMDGRWDKVKRQWSFGIWQDDNIKSIVDHIFGTVDGGQDPSGYNFGSGWDEDIMQGDILPDLGDH